MCFYSDNWKKVNSDPICFGARDNSFGAFTIQEQGLISTFKLVHKSGSIRCNPEYPESYWGCTNPLFINANLMTVITDTNKTALLLAEYLNVLHNNARVREYYTYLLDGYGVNSTTLVFNYLPTPLPASVDQEFQIWYAHDLMNFNEDNNSGQTCADVYAWYT